MTIKFRKLDVEAKECNKESELEGHFVWCNVKRGITKEYIKMCTSLLNTKNEVPSLLCKVNVLLFNVKQTFG